MPRELAGGHTYQSAKRNLIVSTSILILLCEMVLASNKIIFLSLEIIFSQDKLVFYSFFSVLYCIVNLFFKIFTAKKFGDYNKRGQVIELISIGLPLLYAAYALFLPFDKGFL